MPHVRERRLPEEDGLPSPDGRRDDPGEPAAGDAPDEPAASGEVDGPSGDDAPSDTAD